jgi:predicted transcriptional regulator
MKEAHLAIRIEQNKLRKLQQLAKREDRPVSWLIRKAIDRLIERAEHAGKH